MTLLEFDSKFYKRPSVVPPTTLYVFTDSDSADSWIKCKYFGSTDYNYELAFALSSDKIAKYALQEKWCKADVKHFYSVEPDVIVIVIEPYE